MNPHLGNDTYLPAWQCALRLLSVRDHTRFELQAKLHRRAFSNAIIQGVIDECQRCHYLDDGATAIRYLQQLKAKSYGPRRIRQAMQKRGFSAELIDSVLTDGYSAAAEWELADKAVSKKMWQFQRESDLRKRVQKVHRYLYSRGFSASIAAGVTKKRFPPQTPGSHDSPTASGADPSG
jgi:regulatory protein